MAIERWTRNQTKQALYLYFQLPFGQIHYRNPEIVALAAELGRTPSSIAMKLANFASLDPKITQSGRKGLDGATALDREIWAEFHQDWTQAVIESESLLERPESDNPRRVRDEQVPFGFQKYEGPSTIAASVEKRVGQNFFRRAVLANYDVACCITGISDARLLNASHIVPWNADQANRHNPANGLCLSATFDRAFDRGLITILPSFVVKLAACLNEEASDKTRAFFAPYANTQIRPAMRLDPDRRFLEWHNEHCFADAIL